MFLVHGDWLPWLFLASQGKVDRWQQRLDEGDEGKNEMKGTVGKKIIWEDSNCCGDR
jgi:hypothetical protein